MGFASTNYRIRRRKVRCAVFCVLEILIIFFRLKYTIFLGTFQPSVFWLTTFYSYCSQKSWLRKIHKNCPCLKQLYSSAQKTKFFMPMDFLQNSYSGLRGGLHAGGRLLHKGGCQGDQSPTGIDVIQRVFVMG